MYLSWNMEQGIHFKLHLLFHKACCISVGICNKSSSADTPRAPLATHSNFFTLSPPPFWDDGEVFFSNFGNSFGNLSVLWSPLYLFTQRTLICLSWKNMVNWPFWMLFMNTVLSFWELPPSWGSLYRVQGMVFLPIFSRYMDLGPLFLLGNR